MNELINVFVENENQIENIDSQISSLISSLQNEKNRLEEMNKNLRDSLKEEMEKRNLKKLDTDRITLLYVDSTKRTTIDSKRLKEEEPELFEKYSKVSDVKSSIRITIKKFEEKEEKTIEKNNQNVIPY